MSLKKPISDARRKANQDNAKKSTGPRTPEGKAVSSRNALRHGLTARALIPEDLTALGEDYDLLPSLIRDFTLSWNPQTPYEESLVHELAALQIRLSRCTRIETGLLDPKIPKLSPADSRHTINAAIAQAFAANDRFFTLLCRYETSISRAYDRTLKQLIAIRKTKLTPIIDSDPLPPEPPAANAHNAPNGPTSRRLGPFIVPPPVPETVVELLWEDLEGNPLPWSPHYVPPPGEEDDPDLAA